MRQPQAFNECPEKKKERRKRVIQETRQEYEDVRHGHRFELNSLSVTEAQLQSGHGIGYGIETEGSVVAAALHPIPASLVDRAYSGQRL